MYTLGEAGREDEETGMGRMAMVLTAVALMVVLSAGVAVASEARIPSTAQGAGTRSRAATVAMRWAAVAEPTRLTATGGTTT